MTMELIPSDPEERAALQRITAALGGMNGGAKPAADWQARVLAKVRQEAAAKAATAAQEQRDGEAQLALGFWHAMPTLCAAAIMLVWWSPWRASSLPRQLEVEMEASSVVRRGERDGGGAASLGSRVTVAAVSDAPYRAVWVFRGRDQLVVSCPGRGCSSTEDRLSAALTIELVGEYTVVALWSEAPLPEAGADRDAALAAAARAGATVQRQKFRVW